MKNTPYSELPDHCFWPRAVAAVAPHQVDPVVAPPFTLTATDRVATAGSCFAQHIGRHLKASGFNCLTTEAPHPWLPTDESIAFSYGIYTARYGNIYTTRQLLQLFQRAYGSFAPTERLWEAGARCIDPFRPRIQPNGFACREEFEADQQQHFAAVRQAFESLDVLVFTLGLTEAWEAIEDGAVFPLCPGVAGGSFDTARHRWRNFGVAEVVDDMLAFIDLLRSVNPAARLILTVSPVPLVATADGAQHVLAATTYSKSVLRVACAEIVRQREQVAYMPSFEIITGQHARGSYFSADLRSVNEAGVNHVMRVFFRHFTDAPQVPGPGPEGVARTATQQQMAEVDEVVAANCDEEALLPPGARTPPFRPHCNLCGGEDFGPGPRGRLSSNGRNPHCRQCGSLERHRATGQALQALPASYLDWRRALLVGLERDSTPGLFQQCEAAPPGAPGSLAPRLAGYGEGSFDFIALMHVLEYLDDDQSGFDQILRLLSAQGLLQVCFVDPQARPWTSIQTGPAGSARRWYGRDLFKHFNCEARGIHMVMMEATDPGTGLVLPVHFFYRQPQHHEALADASKLAVPPAP